MTQPGPNKHDVMRGADAAGAMVAALPLNIIFGETRLAATDLLWATTTVQPATISMWLRDRVR